MIFTTDQLERFKQYAHRAMVRMEEWKNNRDVQVDRIVEEIQGAFGEGYYTAMHEVRSTPWEYVTVTNHDNSMNAMSVEGWEHVAVCGVDNGWSIWRRRKAVRDLEAQPI